MYITKVQTFEREKFHIYSSCDRNGTTELDTLIVSLDGSLEKQVNKMIATIEKAATHGPQSLPKEICHQIEDKIWQFRADDIRILWFYDKGHLVICTHGFIKKGKKTPASEKSRAKKVMNNYFESQKNGTLKELEE